MRPVSGLIWIFKGAEHQYGQHTRLAPFHCSPRNETQASAQGRAVQRLLLTQSLWGHICWST